MTSYAYANAEHRVRKARTIMAILGENLRAEESHALEIGTGAGYMSRYFAEAFKDFDSLDVVDERQETEGYRYQQVSSVELPFADETFDVVISNQVIEHIAQQAEHVAESFRVLKPGGWLYLATPNRYWPREVHSGIYFLGYHNWAKQAEIFQRKRGKEWDVYLLCIRGLKSLVAKHTSECIDYTPRIVKNPERYEYTGPVGQLKLVNWLPMGALGAMSGVMPSFFLLARKV